jgi:hypothetical protein
MPLAKGYLDRLRIGTELDEQGQRRERVRASTTPARTGIRRRTLNKLEG